MTRKTLGLCMAIVGLVIVLSAFGFRPETRAQQPATPATTGAKYNVIETDASNLIVVDNASNIVYFYTEDPGKEVGNDLHLRGSIDLNEVGKAVIRPKAAAQ